MRQDQPAPPPSSLRPARGLIRQRLSLAEFDLIRFEPSPDLAELVENHWLILWDRGQKPAYEQQNLSHPSQHLVIDPQGRTGIFGVTTGVFHYRLAGSGRVLGTKFRPGAFHALFGKPVSALTDTSVPAETVFARSSADLDSEFIALNDPMSMAERVEDLLRLRQAEPDARARRARALVDRIAGDPALVSVARLAEEAGMSVRSLQRLFDTHIGVSPKWVVDRYRMIEAVDALNRGERISLTALAHDLGYFDQAHFTKAFQALTGQPPSRLKSG